MKILLVGRFYEEGLATLIKHELELLGHQVIGFDPGPKLHAFGSRAAYYVHRVKSIAHGAIGTVALALGHSGQIGALRRTIEASPGLELTLVCHDFLTPAEAAEVKRLTRAPLVLWYPDHIAAFQRHMFLNGPYDFLFFKDPYIGDILRRNVAAPVYYLPECFSPTALPVPEDGEPIDKRYQADIATAGSMYAYRIAFFRNLAGYDVKLWGLPPPLWMNLGPVAPMVLSRFVAGQEKAKAFRGAKIVVNNTHPAEIWGTNVRTFEACGAGAFQMVDWRPGLSQLFEPDRELVTFGSLRDLKEKIEYYLPRPDERRAIAAAGRVRALRDHTYEERLKLLLDTVAGVRTGYPEPRVALAKGEGIAIG